MKLRVLMMIVPWLLICCSGQGGTESVRSPVERPNFIVIILDDWGAGDAGFEGHPLLRTPHLDAIARQGMVRERAFLTTSSCTASRASILTGRYPHASGAPHLHDELPAKSMLLSDVLRQHGYFTAAAGKWHIGNQVMDHFDRVVDSGGESGAEDWTTLLQKRPPEQPFFFWLASRDPHLPYSPLDKKSIYQPEDVRSITPFMVNGLKTRTNLAQYYNEIHRIDGKIGELMQALEDSHLADTTYVVVMSDNGAPFPRAKTTLYDSGLRTPFIIRGPGIPAGSRSTALFSSIDLAPTLADLAGTPHVEAFQGNSEASLWLGKKQTGREYVFAEQFNHGYQIHKQAIRDERFLYIRNMQTTGTHCLLELQGMREELVAGLENRTLTETQSRCFMRKWPAEELYDVLWDPYQLHNLMQPADRQLYEQERGALRRKQVVERMMERMTIESAAY